MDGDDDLEKIIGWVVFRGLICIGLFGLGLAIWGFFAFIRRVNQRDDPLHAKRPPDAP